MALALFGWYILLYFITKKYDADFIIISCSRKRKYCPELRYQVSFQLFLGAEKRTAANVHKQHYNQLPFFFKDFHKGMGKTGGYIPIYKLHIVAGYIFPYLAKRHTPPFESGMIFSGENMIA